MKLSNKMMIELLREEYEKRLNSFLGEVEVRAEHSQSDSELVDNALGLKVKDRAGFVYTIAKIEPDASGQVFVYLKPPGESVEYFESDLGVDSGFEEDDSFVGDGEVSSEVDEYLVGDKEDEEAGDFIYSSVNEEEAVSSKKSSVSKDMKKKLDKLDVREPNKKAKFKKQLKIDIEADAGNYEEVNGFIKITLKQLEDEYTL